MPFNLTELFLEPLLFRPLHFLGSAVFLHTLLCQSRPSVQSVRVMMTSAPIMATCRAAEDMPHQMYYCSHSQPCLPVCETFKNVHVDVVGLWKVYKKYLCGVMLKHVFFFVVENTSNFSPLTDHLQVLMDRVNTTVCIRQLSHEVWPGTVGSTPLPCCAQVHGSCAWLVHKWWTMSEYGMTVFTLIKCTRLWDQLPQAPSVKTP